MLSELGRALALGLLLAAAVWYGRGWAQQRRLAPAAERPTVGRLLGPLMGLLLLALVWASSLHDDRLFSGRVLQHLVVTALAPPLLLAPDPWPLLAAGLPAGFKRRLKSEQAWVQPAWLPLASAPAVAWGSFIFTFWAWYDPGLVQAARDHSWVRLMEWLTLFVTAMLYWWHITQAHPRLHTPMPPIVRIVYAFGGVIPVKIVGLVLLFSLEQMLLPSSTAPTLAVPMVVFGPLRFSDAALGALLIWVVGGTAFAYAAIYLAGRWLQPEVDKPPFSLTMLDHPGPWHVAGKR